MNNSISTRERYKGLLYGALAGDSLALASHWIYDQGEIGRRFGRITELQAPNPEGYHGGKAVGDQTHYGDQVVILMDSLEACGGKFVLRDFAQRWRDFWKDAKSYRDHATKDTLARMEKGGDITQAGSESTELGGAGRIAPLLVALREEKEALLIEAVRAQTAVTHDSPEVVDAAEFIARTTFLLVGGAGLSQALEQAAASPYRDLKAQKYLSDAKKLNQPSTVEAVEKLGQSCSLEKALPSIFAILLRQGDNAETALIENVMAGGDSASRGVVLGLMLGAAHGFSALPSRWIEPLSARAQAEKFLNIVGLD